MSSGLPGLRSSDSQKRLSIYLADHLAGSTTGLELARRVASSNQGTEVGVALSRIVAEIEEDRESLKDLMRRVGAARDPLKEGLAWTGEKIGRLKLNGQLLGYSPLSRMVELEALMLGVTGKLGLWEAIEATLAGDPRLSGFDLERLIARATEQRETLNALRLDAAREAFGSAQRVPV